MPYPERSPHDLVGVDNRRAGYIATAHLLGLGVHQLVYFAEELAANTVDARITGFYEALRVHGVKPESKPVWRGSPLDEIFVRRMYDTTRPQGIVCANDLTAARLMQVFAGMGIPIPEEIRIVGMDDVRYASLLQVPLTTIHQDCSGIGAAAMATMLERSRTPKSPCSRRARPGAPRRSALFAVSIWQRSPNGHTGFNARELLPLTNGSPNRHYPAKPNAHISHTRRRSRFVAADAGSRSFRSGCVRR